MDMVGFHRKMVGCKFKIGCETKVDMRYSKNTPMCLTIFLPPPLLEKQTPSQIGTLLRTIYGCGLKLNYVP